ncbi:MAG TPA: peptidoglycan editing factor PgeF [Rhodocyclaceae bacterium]|nr:peptidoglycan editing factor PgeF [Rhodocyclaceae bacterium]
MADFGPHFIEPDWPAPANVRALSTTRTHGNLADHVGDAKSAVVVRRAGLRAHLPAEPKWLTQVHGIRCVDSETAATGVEADASFARSPGVVCAVLTADCLPVLLCDDAGSVVAAAHAGWRGLAAGVVEATVAATGIPGARLMAWFGPAIGPTAFEVGDEVRAAFVDHDAAAAEAFVARPNGKWFADLYALARQRLAALGVTRVFGGDRCTFTEADHFFSYRREGNTGRMATLIWTL